jgi:hypothetical protein
MQSDTDRERRIAERAQALWEKEGRPRRDKHHWSQAEGEFEPGADAGPAQLREHYAPGESAVPGPAGASTDLTDALAQAGEGVTGPDYPTLPPRGGGRANP